MAANLELTAKEDISEKLFKLEQQNQRLIQQNRELANASKKAHDESLASAQGQISSITSMVTGYLTLEGAIHAVTGALEHKEEVERRAKEVTIGSADAQRTMFRNLGNIARTDQDAFIRSLENLNKQYTPQGGMRALYGEAAAVLPATAGDRDLTAKILEATSRYAPDSSEARQMTGMAIAGLGKATGSKRPMENLGFLINLSSKTAITDLDKLATGVIGAKEFGGSAQEAGAVLAAISQGSGDKSPRSITAGIAFAEQLEKFLPREDRYEWTTDSHGHRRKRRAARATGLETELERIEYLQEHPLDREQFLSGLSVPAKQQAAVIQLLSGKDTITGKYMEDALKTMDQPLASHVERCGG